MPGIASSSPAVLIAHLASVDDDAPSRLRRRDAAEPPAARDRGAVRDARGAAPRADRPRDRPGAGHRPGHGGGAAARRSTASADDLPTQLAELLAFFAGTYPARSRPSRARATSPRSGCSARATSARGSPASSGCRSRSRTTSCRRTRSPALEIYRRSFTPSPTLGEPYAMIGVAVVCAESDERRPLAARLREALVPAPPHGPPAHAPLARGGRRVRVHARPARVRRQLDRVPRRRLARDGTRRAARAAARARRPTS